MKAQKNKGTNRNPARMGGRSSRLAPDSAPAGAGRADPVNDPPAKGHRRRRRSHSSRGRRRTVERCDRARGDDAWRVPRGIAEEAVPAERVRGRSRAAVHAACTRDRGHAIRRATGEVRTSRAMPPSRAGKPEEQTGTRAIADDGQGSLPSRARSSRPEDEMAVKPSADDASQLTISSVTTIRDAEARVDPVREPPAASATAILRCPGQRKLDGHCGSRVLRGSRPSAARSSAATRSARPVRPEPLSRPRRRRRRLRSRA